MHAQFTGVGVDSATKIMKSSCVGASARPVVQSQDDSSYVGAALDAAVPTVSVFDVLTSTEIALALCVSDGLTEDVLNSSSVDDLVSRVGEGINKVGIREIRNRVQRCAMAAESSPQMRRLVESEIWPSIRLQVVATEVAKLLGDLVSRIASAPMSRPNLRVVA